MPSPEKPLLLLHKKGKVPVPVLLFSLSDKSVLMTYSEDDSDTNETSHNAEIFEKTHSRIPPRPLSPRRTPHEPVRALGCEWDHPDDCDDCVVPPIGTGPG